SEAAPVNLHTVLRLYSAGIHHTADPTAPVTPAFLAGRPQDMAFELAVEAGSVNERHHTRVWASGLTLADGTPIWVATASLDDRVEIKFPMLLPNHHIDPAIDLERDFIAESLAATGLVRDETRIQAVAPEFGTNAAGDPFFTYGVAAIIDLS
ncbi:MAG: LssY C-terminal domain-containing protein, partial [Actinomycetota bacterium]|nr:LssY C-terminal domain-containing protein [Actinomycetota bacterium]